MPVENLTIKWIALSSIRTTGPRGEHRKNAHMFDFYEYSHLVTPYYAVPLYVFAFSLPDSLFKGLRAFIDYYKIYFDAYIKYSILHVEIGDLYCI
jgi:hypothetical protein